MLINTQVQTHGMFFEKYTSTISCCIWFVAVAHGTLHDLLGRKAVVNKNCHGFGEDVPDLAKANARVPFV